MNLGLQLKEDLNEACKTGQGKFEARVTEPEEAGNHTYLAWHHPLVGEPTSPITLTAES